MRLVDKDEEVEITLSPFHQNPFLLPRKETQIVL
jgi:hypothetical protein